LTTVKSVALFHAIGCPRQEPLGPIGKATGNAITKKRGKSAWWRACTGFAGDAAMRTICNLASMAKSRKVAIAREPAGGQSSTGKARMWRLLRASVPIATVVLASAALPAGASAETCTNRQLICFDYCARNYNDAPRCVDGCKHLLAQCFSTGCWESKITARRCGLEPR
jgi:hypothetical protein